MLQVLRRTVQAYGEDNAPLLAAALAYFSVFSLAPLLVVLIALLVFFGAGEAQATVLRLVADVVGEQGAAIVRTMIESQASAGGGVVATATGAVVLLFGATTLFAQVQRVLNVVWGTRPEHDSKLASAKHLVVTRLRSLALIGAIGALLLVALLLTTVVSAAVAASGDALPGGVPVWRTLNRLVAFAVLVLVFALVFKLLPNAHVPWRATWIGAAATALLFVVASWLFGLYIANVAVASAYGAAGSLVVLLLWVYVSAQTLLFGAELTQVLAQRLPGAEGIGAPAD
jgi:membrane protein